MCYIYFGLLSYLGVDARAGMNEQGVREKEEENSNKSLCIVLVSAVGNWGPSGCFRIDPLLLAEVESVNFWLVWG